MRDQSLDHFIRDALREHDGEVTCVVAEESVGKTGEAKDVGTLPGHAVEGFIARGGMGAVYRARQTALDREVAVKVMTRLADSPEIAERFRREALVLGRLAHPNIVPVYDIGTDDEGQLYYTMKLVKGRTLQQLIAGLRDGNAETLRRYSLASLLTVFRKVCDALAFAHSKGILHRDLKPENVMVGEFGEVLVMDWGLAKMIDGGSGESAQSSVLRSQSEHCALRTENLVALRTLDGSVIGTPQYMSPEQAMGHIDELDERSDIFALGGILYAILTLRPPVEGTSLAEVLAKVTSAEITSPSDLQAGTSAKGKTRKMKEVLEAKLIKPLPHAPGGRVPPALSSVVMKALQLDKTRRYPSVAALSAEIEAFQGGFATQAEHASALKQLKLLMLRHRAVTASLVATLVLSVGFVVKVMASERAAKASEAVAVRERQSTRRALAKSALALAEAALREANGPEMQAALIAVPEDLRDSNWSYLLNQSDSSIARIRTSTHELEGAAADPSHPGVFAVADWNHKITVLNVRTGERLLEFQPGFARNDKAVRYRLAFTPDGRHLAIGRDSAGGIVIHRTGDGVKEREWAAPATTSLEYGSDTKLLQKSNDGILLWDTTSSTLLWKDRADGNVGVWGVFMPGGNEVIRYGNVQNRPGKHLQVVSATDGSLIRDLGGRKTGYDWGMVACPDGRAVFTWNESGITECVSLQDGKVLFSLPQKKTRSRMGITRDGSQLVTLTPLKDGVQSIEIWNAHTGDLLRTVLGGLGAARNLSVHPHSHEVLVTGPKSRVWDLTGPVPGWRYPVLLNSPVTFWGSDDLIYAAPGIRGPWGLQRLQPGGMESVWSSPSPQANASAVSADGRIGAICTPGYSPQISLLRKSGAGVELFATFQSFNPYRLRLSPNGARLAVMAKPQNARLRIIDTATGTTALEPEFPEGRRVNELGWLGSKHLLGLVTLHADRGNPGAEERIVLWDTATGKVLQSTTHRTTMDALAIAPDDNRFAEGGSDKRVRIRDAASLAVQQEFRAHDGPITALAWHPTKPILATASTDLSVRLWNLETGQRLEEFHGPLREVTQLAFSPSGRRLGGAAANEGFARIWEPEVLE